MIALPMPNRFVPLALAIAATLAPALARAQAGDETVRRDLITQGVAAAGRGDHAGAAAAFERASAIRATPSVEGHLCLQLEQVPGRTADALAACERCYATAIADERLHERAQIVAGCGAARDRLAPRVGRVAVRVEPRPAGLRVEVAGHELAAAVVGLPYPVTPGTVVVRASAPGYRAAERRVDVAAGRTADVALALEASTAGSVPPAPPGPGAGPFVLMGVGGAVALASIPFWVLRGAAVGDLERACPTVRPDGSRMCVDAGAVSAGNAAQDAIALHTAVGATLVAVGGAAIVSGVVWLAAAPRGAPAPATVAVLPTAGGAVAAVGARF
jgi:hypothetical protein